MIVPKCWLSSCVLTSILAFLLSNAPALAESPESAAVSTEGSAGSETSINNIFDRTPPSNPEKFQFSAEISRLLRIFANSVYTAREAFMRELISNAKDAINKRYMQNLAKAAEQVGDLDDMSNYKVVVDVDKEKRTVSITDNGIGMTHDQLIEFLGTIANSGTSKFAAAMAQGKNQPGGDASLIGQFGVGFYSVLVVAEKVAVVSKSDDDPKQWIWETDTSATFNVYEDPNGATLGRGTRVILKLKDDADEFLDYDNLQKVLKGYFGDDRHRIYLLKPKTVTEEVPIEEEGLAGEEKKETKDDKENEVEVEEESKEKEKKPKTKKIEKTIIEEVLISQNVKPVCSRHPSEVKPEEYEALYKSISGDKYGKPLTHVHFSGETAKGESFRAIIYIPERRPFEAFSSKEYQLDIKLYVRGVPVTAKLDDFVPKYLSFVKIIIHSDDLSLNISRDILQDTSELRVIKKKVVKKIIEMMIDLAADEEKYKKFYDTYSAFIKLEIGEHDDYRSLLSRLLRYKSTKSGSKVRSLDDYIEGLSEEQKARKSIYYLAGQAGEVEKSPFLGRFKERGVEVLLMTEPVDEHCIQRLEKYGDYKFINIAKDGVKLDDDDEKEMKELESKYKTAQEWIGKALKDIVEKVVLVPGPAEVPGSLKSTEYGWTGNMERLVLAQSSVKEDPMLSFFAKQKKILELNPKNSLVSEILERANAGKGDKELKTLLRTLTDSMMVWSGYNVRDSAVFAKGIERLTRKALNLPVEELKSEPEEEGDDDDNGKKPKAKGDADEDDSLDLGSISGEDIDADILKKMKDLGVESAEMRSDHVKEDSEDVKGGSEKKSRADDNDDDKNPSSATKSGESIEDKDEL